MLLGPPAQGPVILAVRRGDWLVVYAGDAPAHQSFSVELPVLIAVAAEPATAIVAPFIGKVHGDPFITERPEFLDQPIVQFALPLARQECFDCVATVQELDTVAPLAVFAVGLHHSRR